MEWHSSAMSFSASFFIFHTDSTNSRFSAKQKNIYFPFLANSFIFHTDSTNSRFSAKDQNIYFVIPFVKKVKSQKTGTGFMSSDMR